jgi:two-component system sensor histidine kinase KdpD
VPRRAGSTILSLAGIAAATALMRATVPASPTTVALGYLLIVLFAAAYADLWTAVGATIAAVLCFNFFFLPPVGTFSIADPQNWAALIAFLAVSIVASNLSTSARARAREAMERQLEIARLSDRAELSSALLASLSHDLRTPLTAIRTAVANLDTPMLPEDQRREQAGVAADQLERLTRLFEEILDMARIEAGSVLPHRGWVTPAEIVEAGVSHAAAAVDSRDLIVDASDEETVELDPRLTSAALAHLLENAAHYAPDGPIHVRAWIDGEGLCIEVADSGPGVASGEVDRVFEPFYRGSAAAGRFPGTGMGLAITRGLLAAEGGRVWAENAPTGGARFTMAVPARSRVISLVD